MKRRSEPNPMKWLLLLSLLITSMTNGASAEEKSVTIVVRSFLAAQKEDSKIFVKTSGGAWAVRAPPIPLPKTEIGRLYGTCFSTDDRNFSISIDASARISISIKIVLSENMRDMSYRPVPGKSWFVEVGETHNIDCKTGKDLQSPKTGQGAFNITPVTVDGWTSSFSWTGSASDPFYALFGVPAAPRIDMNATVTYDVLKKTIRLKGRHGVFPSFEGYLLTGSETHTLFTWSPTPTATPLDLVDLWTDKNSVPFDATISIRKYLLASP